MKISKKIAAVTVCLLLGLQIAGCGKAEKGNTTASKEFVYVADFQETNAETGYAESTCMSGDQIFYLSSTYDEDTEKTHQNLCFLTAGTGDIVKKELDIGEDTRLANLFLAGDGNFKIIRSTSNYDEEEQDIAEEGTDGDQKKEDTSIEESQTEDAKTEEGKTEDAKTEEGKAEDAKTEEGKAKDAKTEEGKAEDAKAEDAKAEDANTESDSAASEAEKQEGTEGTAAGTRIIDAPDNVEITPIDNPMMGGGGGMAIMSSASVSGEEYKEPVSTTVEICDISKEGVISNPIDISSIFEDTNNMYVQYAVMDKDGNTYLLQDQKIMVLDRGGKKIADIAADNWISNMFATKDGAVMAVYYGQNGMELHPIDLSAKAFGPADQKIQSAMSKYGSSFFTAGKETDILFSTDNLLFSYNFGDAEPVEILNWIDCDVNSNGLQGISVLEDGKILAIANAWGADSRTEFVTLTKKKGSEIPEKKILTFATMYMDEDTKKQIIKFNKTNTEYRIETKEYLNIDNQEEGSNQFKAAIMSGDCPDIINFAGSSISKYIEKGILEDLYPFMEKDGEIKKEDYIENILKAFESDGKLYTIAPWFRVTTVVAHPADVGDKTSITMDEMIEISNNLPEGTELFEDFTKEAMLSSFLSSNADQYINWGTGECSFDGEDFIKLLEFSNTFPKEYSDREDQISTPEKIRDGKLIMHPTSFGTLHEYMTEEGLFGESMVCIGLPSTNEVGSKIILFGSTFGMSAKSEYKDGVWQFIRMGITEEAMTASDESFRWGFPIMKSALEEQFKQDMTKEYYEDANGEKKESIKHDTTYNNYNVKVYAATQKQVDSLKKLIGSLNSVGTNDIQIMNIVLEEATPFFEGQKTAEEVAKIIQGRIQTYVNENS